MKNLREIKQLVFAILIIVVIVLSAINLSKITKLESKINNLKDADTIVVTDDTKEAETVENRNKCPHNWKVLDKDDSWHSSIVTCDKCGEIKLVDYRNHRRKKAE